MHYNMFRRRYIIMYRRWCNNVSYTLQNDSTVIRDVSPALQNVSHATQIMCCMRHKLCIVYDTSCFVNVTSSVSYARQACSPSYSFVGSCECHVCDGKDVAYALSRIREVMFRMRNNHVRIRYIIHFAGTYKTVRAVTSQDTTNVTYTKHFCNACET